MIQFLGKQMATAFLQILIVATIVFLLLRIMPGDPAALVLGTERGGDPEAVAEMRTLLGLDQPILVQYTAWFKDLLQFDFGQSLFRNTEVTTFILDGFPKTLELALAAIIIASIIGIPLGVVAAVKRGGLIDLFVSVLAATGISLPVYVSGTFFVLLFSFQLNILPASGYVNFSEDPVGHVLRLLLPAVTIALPLAASIARMTRSSMLEVLGKDFVQTLRAKGLPEKTIIFKHTLRNAIISVITVIGLELGNLIGGTVLIEFLYNWPGLSTLLVDAVNNRDYPLIQGCIIVIAGFYIFVNRFVEIIYGVMDPRTR